jgi:aspartyl-tRNA(Asn)/glutamyl-tRNA(Gln) amidotransferase subunit A
LRRIESSDAVLGAFNATTPDLALQMAEQVDQKVRQGQPVPLLAGVPIAIKDNINIQGINTTCSSKILQGYKASYNATVIDKLVASMMPMVGKTNLDEFAMGSSTENSALKLTRNPWDTARVPGGSSGGSAACVAGLQVPLSLGSDTGGSVRQPASLCGIVGIKPTYGLVSRFGLVAFASSLDQISPFSRNVSDAAALLGIIAGFDPKDSTSVDTHHHLDYMSHIDAGVKGLKIGLISELDGEGLQPEVASAMENAVRTYEALGATVSRVSIPSIEACIAAYYILATAEASSNLARFDGVRYGYREPEQPDLISMYCKTRDHGFGAEVKRRIMLGTFCLSSGYYDAYYGQAQKVRTLLAQEFARAFAAVDLLICPTSPTTAFKIGEKASDPVSMYLSDIATIPVNMVGIPAMSIPCGFDAQGLPIGLQLIGPKWSEAKLFQAAKAFESQTGWFNLDPGRR